MLWPTPQALRFMGCISMLQVALFVVANGTPYGAAPAGRQQACCSDMGTLVVIGLSWAGQVDIVLPILFLLQRSYTARSFRRSVYEALFIGLYQPVLWGVASFAPFSAGTDPEDVQLFLKTMQWLVTAQG